MKKKIQILLMISILLSGVSWLDCMMTSAARQTATKIRRPITGGISTAAAARLAAVKSQTPLLARTVQTKSDTSTWSGWFQSWFRGSQSTPVTSSRTTVARTARSPFAPIQQSSYHTTVPQKSWFASFFQAKPERPLTIDDLSGILREYFEQPKGQYGRWVFGAEQLEKAKERLSFIVQKYPEFYRDAIVWKFTSRQPNLFQWQEPLSYNITYNFTILDEVLFRVFKGDKDPLWPGIMNPSEGTCNLVKLVKYLKDMGLRINPRNRDMYRKAYSERLMDSYKRLHGSNPMNKFPLDYEIENLKEIFKELDPILEEIIPGFKQEIEMAQEERKKIEAERLEQNTSSNTTDSQFQTTDDALLKLKTDLGLLSNASAIDTKKKWLAVSKLNHPDTRKPATATMTEEEYKNLSSLYSSVSEVLDKQAREEAAQMRKAAQQKVQQAKE